MSLCHQFNTEDQMYMCRGVRFKQQLGQSVECAGCTFSYCIECTKPAVDCVIDAGHHPLAVICGAHYNRMKSLIPFNELYKKKNTDRH